MIGICAARCWTLDAATSSGQSRALLVLALGLSAGPLWAEADGLATPALLPASSTTAAVPAESSALPASTAQPATLAKATLPKPKQLEGIQVTATLRPEAAIEVSAPVTVIGPERLQNQGLTAIEALRGQPGAFVQQTTPGQSAVFVRGAKGSEVLHLVDGFRLNNAIFRNAPNQYFSLVDGQMLDRIEIVRGSSGMIYGSDAMGGVVQMISRDPLDLDPHSHSQTLRVRADTGEDLLLGHYAGAIRSEDFAAQIALTSIDTDGRRIGSGQQLPASNFSSQAVSARIGYDAGSGGRLALNFQQLRQPRTPRHDELVPGFGQAQSAAEVALFEPQDRQFVQLTHAAQVSWLGFDHLDWQLGSQNITDDRRTRNRGSVSEARERNQDRLNGASVKLSRIDHGAHALVVGAEVYHDRVHSARTNTNINTGIESVAGPRFPNAATEQNISLFALDDWRINQRFDLVLSGRYSTFDIHLPAAGSTPLVKLSPDAFSGHFGLSYALNDQTRLVTNIGRGFRAPNIFDLGQFGDRPGNRFATPNPNLAAERVVDVDLGIKHQGDRFTGELFVFQNHFTDKIVTALTGEVTAGGRLLVQNRNAASAKSYGIEAGASYRFSDSLESRAALNYTRGTERLDGVSGNGDRVPPLTVDLALDWHASPALTWSFEAFSADRQNRLSARDRTDPRINPDGTPGYTRFDIAGRYAVNEQIDLLARIDNIADHNFREHGSGINAIGRNFALGLDLRF